MGTLARNGPPRKTVSGCLYTTGTLAGPSSSADLPSSQFTFTRPRIFGLIPTVLQLVLTDLLTGRHWFTQEVIWNLSWAA
jgi:hypothetical protein